MQKVAIILVLIACIALLLFLVYFSFKLLRDTQKQMQIDKDKRKLDRTFPEQSKNNKQDLNQ
ncbi:MAG: hypothetical protein H9855_00775 [Candidatus Acinetobacter avistercoris]|nr:hypothetical protein [Candidatus Acinetobacter avistercoris]